MITLANVTEFMKEYNCITADITANKHIPDAKGNLLGVKVENGDILFNFETSDTYKYDEENKVWKLL